MLWNILDMLVEIAVSAFSVLFSIVLIMIGAAVEWPIMVIVGVVLVIVGAIAIVESIYICVILCKHTNNEALLEKEAA